MPVSANSLATILQVYSQKSLEQNIVETPLLKNVWLDVSSDIMAGGQAVITRLPTTSFSTPGDLTTGWTNTTASTNNITVTLKGGVYDHVFNELEWATMTPTTLQEVTFPGLTKQLFNGIVVDALSNVTSSNANVITVVSASNVTLATLQSGSNKLSTAEAPHAGRLAILTPNAFQGLVSSVQYAYQYGGTQAIQEYQGIRVAGFDAIEYPRLLVTTPVPGGAKYNGTAFANYTNNPAGFCLAKTAVVVAMRQPVDVNYGANFSGTATKNGISLQTRVAFDISKPGWRVAAISIYGTAAGNPTSVVPILPTSGQQ
jgi:hypothetical protein